MLFFLNFCDGASTLAKNPVIVGRDFPAHRLIIIFYLRLRIQRQ